MTKSDHIWIEDMGRAGISINKFKRAMGVAAIGLVKVSQLIKIGILEMGNTGLNPKQGRDRIGL